MGYFPELQQFANWNPWPIYFDDLPDMFMVLFHRDVLN